MSDNQIHQIEGVWLTGLKDAHVEISIDDNGKAQGSIVWMERDKEEDGGPRIDKLNPDASLRERFLDGMIMLSDFDYKGKGQWEDGSVYDPDSGKTYSGSIQNSGPNVLKMRGYVGIKLFGRTELWTRVS
ncbi:DUF2147 domain-containing protein [Flammeovirga kamogawensis]|uniref:DUF2147 domain-containing protein n=1 Tax=Flammeovirga kamogawensis TaxID=373891 RepID=A0ABX8GV92_9BACT|nr:DUF2147 domain-containing protein [Flammeovirga kamogawensis]MBB6461637.1 uncharacterized protein (DUF2147 family) [Flammeovirga kamogawensis]QWG07436.1 DUF2147 domain-containing protein [Flammeovirga kamogawensis]TRX69247.1 DUF2147 domain-containing protein [Flammeovirga kamogawensis]